MKRLHSPIDPSIQYAQRVDEELLTEVDPLDLIRLPMLKARDKRLFVELDQRVGDGTVLYPVLPDTTVEVLRLIDDPEAQFDAIENALEQDSILCSEVIRNANSVWFGARIMVEETHGALMRLGKRNLRNILLGVSLKLSLAQGPGSITQSGEAIWRHSMATGAVARMVATALGGDRDHWFLAGLMHDMGEVALLATVRDIVETSMRGYSPDLQALGPILRWHHQEVGRIAASHWNLPADLISSVAHHHRPKRAENHGVLASVVNIANRITRAFEAKQPPTEAQEITRSPGGLFLKLSDENAESIIEASIGFFEGLGGDENEEAK